MSNELTIFERIIHRELPANIAYEDDDIIVIHDIHPIAPVHLLIISKKKIANIQSVPKEDLSLIAKMVSVAQEMAKKFQVEEGYRLITNNGATAGQVIYHLHFHLIGGRHLGILG
jgi:histidine triad (HIT) family protein